MRKISLYLPYGRISASNVKLFLITGEWKVLTFHTVNHRPLKDPGGGGFLEDIGMNFSDSVYRAGISRVVQWIAPA